MPKLNLEKSFIRKANKPVKRSSDIDNALSKVLKTLQDDPFTPWFKNHPLKGLLNPCMLVPCRMK